MKTVRIKRDTTNDDILIRLQEQTLPTDTPLERQPKSVWWIAWDGDKPVGYAALHPLPREKGGYLARAGVLKSHRGHGLQKRLIKARIDYARKAGWTFLVSDTVFWNAASMRSMIACGFRPYRPQNQWALDKSTYWKRLV